MGRKIDSVLKGFTAQKCLTLLKLTTPRITVSRNRRNIAVRQMRGEIAQLLKSGQASQVYDTKIDSLIKEESMVAVYDLLDHFCNSIISQFPVIETQRYCPPDLKEAIATLIYAAPRCVELAELNQVKDMLTTKYGKEFTVAAEEIQPECGVNRQIIEMLSLRPVSEQTKVKKMREVCVQHNIEWRPEWAPNSASDWSNRARGDDRRAAKDDRISESRSAVASSSSRSSNLVHGMNAHPHRGSRHGEGTRSNMRSSESMDESYKAASPGIGPRSDPFSGEEVKRANIRVSEGVNEPYRPRSPGFGQKGRSLSKEEVTRVNTRGTEEVSEPYKPGFGTNHSSLPREELPKANMKVSEGVNEPYRPSPGFGAKIPKEEVTTAVSEGMNEPCKPAHGSKRGSLSKANIKVLESMHEPYNPGFGPKHDSIPREENARDKIPRANIRLSERINEPNKPSVASFGNYKAADYKQDGHGDRANYHTQYHDEISDSGSEVFVSVEDDEVILSHKDELSATVTQNNFQGNMEDHSSKPNLRAQSLRASRETNLSKERSSLKASKDNSLNTKESFKADNRTEEEHYACRNKWAEQQSFVVASKGNPSNEPRVVNDVPTVEKIVAKPAFLSSDRSKEEDEFASTARAIAAEAARLAVLDYARRYSRSGSVSLDLGDLPEDALESMKEKVVDSVGSKRDYTKERYNHSSKTGADHDKDYEYGTEYQWDETDKEAEEPASNADVNPFAKKRGDQEAIIRVHISKSESPSLSVKKEKEELERTTQRRRGEKPKFDNERNHNFVDVNTRFDNASQPTHNHGKPVNNVQGPASQPTHNQGKPVNNVQGPMFDQVAYREVQFFEEISKPYNASSMSEKGPVFDKEPDLYFGSAHRSTYSQEMSNKQHQSSYTHHMSHDTSRDQMWKNHAIHQPEEKSAVHSQAMRKSSPSSMRGKQEEDLQDKAQIKKTNGDPNASRGQFISDRTAKSRAPFAQQQQMSHEESDADERFANRNAASTTRHRENSMRSRPQTANDTWEATRAEEDAMNRREARSPVKRNKQTPVAEQDKLIYEEKHGEKVEGNNSYNMIKQSIGSPQQRVASKEDKGGARDGQGHAMSSMSSRSPKANHRHPEKNILDEVLGAKWHGDDVSSTQGTQHDKMENIQSFQKSPSSYRHTEGSYNTQNKSQEPVTRNKPFAQDAYMGKRTPSQQEHHEREPDLVSLYTPHGHIDDLVNKGGGPSNLMSVRQKSHREDIEVATPSYKPYMQHDSMGRRTGPLQKQEEQESASKNNVKDQLNRPGKNQGKQDSWPEKEQPQNHKEHQKPSFDQRATSMSPNHRHEPPTRKPPPLPQKNASIPDRSKHPEAAWGQQHSQSRSQKKQEEEGAYNRNSAMLDRRSEPPTRPPPQVMANTPTANDRKSPAELDKEESWPPTRQQPAMPTRQKPSPLESSVSDPATKPSSSSMPSSSVSASTKLASSSSADPPAPKVTPKFPHVDDIAANLDALYQAAKLRKPK